MRFALSIAWETEIPFRLLSKRTREVDGDRGLLMAYYLFVRLWNELALSARATDRMGLLSEETAQLWADRAQVDLHTAGPDGGWLGVLVAAQVLERLDGGGYFCPHFNPGGMNEACRRGYELAQRKGGLFGTQSRRQKTNAREADDLAMTLLPADAGAYHDLEGTPLDVSRRAAALALIRTLDQSLRLTPRPIHAGHWPMGEVALADAVVREFGPEKVNVNGRSLNGLDAVALYLLANHGDPRLPQGTQQALQVFSTLLTKARDYHRTK